LFFGKDKGEGMAFYASEWYFTIIFLKDYGGVRSFFIYLRPD